MASAFSDNTLAVESKVTELLTVAGWTKRRYTGAASGSFYVAKTGTIAPEFPGVGQFIALYCDWKHGGAVQLWPATYEPERIAQEVLAAAAAAVYPAITFLTNSGGEHNEDDLPEKVVNQVPFEDGPGDVRPYLVRIEGQFYVLGSLEVPYQDPFWGKLRDKLEASHPDSDGLELPPENIVTKACEAAIIAMRATSAPGVIVYPLDFDEMPGRCVISAALPVREDSPATMKERLANTFRGYEDTDNLIALAA